MSTPLPVNTMSLGQLHEILNNVDLVCIAGYSNNAIKVKWMNWPTRNIPDAGNRGVLGIIY
jgi:hypothetical protein